MKSGKCIAYVGVLEVRKRDDREAVGKSHLLTRFGHVAIQRQLRGK
jgi:hypothetical protein